MRSGLKSTKKSSPFLTIAAIFGITLSAATTAEAARQFEYLDRGVVAVRQNQNKALVSWRSLATDESGLGFNVYRSTEGNTVRLNGETLFGGTNFIDSTADFSQANTYFVKKVLDRRELETRGSYTMPANKGVGAYITVPVEKMESTVHFVWVGDLDGDGAYDYVLDQPNLEHQQLQAYNSQGEYLWTVDLGANSENKNNISPGASTIDVGMWDGATVYDIDMDGFAEVLVRVADGVTFGDGKKFNTSITNGQAIAVLDGRTGALKYSAELPTDYISIGPLAAMMEIGYLDGKTPSLVCWFKNRNADKSFNSITVAYHMSNGKFVQQWKHDAGKQGGGAEAHQIRIADVDYDGKDEVLHQGYALNGDGSLRYQIPHITHGDRWYVGAFKKGDKVMMGYGIQQDHPQNLLEYYYNASTGEILWTHYGDESCAGQCDVARGNVGDIDPNHDGFEVWSFQGTYSNDNQLVASNYLYPVLRYWWDGDVAAESYNDGKIEKWDYANKSVNRVSTTWKVYASSGSERGVAMFHGDILGDWREESILVNYENKELVIFTTDISSDVRLYSLMQNPCYRNGTTTKGYVQASMLDYFLGYGMETPAAPDIEIIGGERESSFGARAFLKKCGANSRNQSLSVGDSLGAFCFKYGNGELSVKNLIEGISLSYSTYNDTAEVWFSGVIPESQPTGNYPYTVKVSGALNDTSVVGTLSVENPNVPGSSSSEALSSNSEGGTLAVGNSAATLGTSKWRLTTGEREISFRNGNSPAALRVFDTNGKLLAAKNLNAKENWVLPKWNSVVLLQVKSGGISSMRRIAPAR